MKRVNVRDARGKATEVYVGRGSYARKGHVLSNPYKVTAHTVAGHMLAVGHYRRWLWTQIQNKNKFILRALEAMGPETVLLCHCKDNMPCHGDIIIKAWHYCWEQGIIPPPVTAWEAPDRTKPRTAPILFAVTETQPYTSRPTYNRKNERVA